MAAHDRGMVALAPGRLRPRRRAAGAGARAGRADQPPADPPAPRGGAGARRPSGRGRGRAARDDARAGAPERLPGDAGGEDGARAGPDRGARRAIDELAERRLSEAAEGWRRQVSTLSRGDSLAVALADLGRPVVGLIEPERELERVLRRAARTFKQATKGARTCRRFMTAPMPRRRPRRCGSCCTTPRASPTGGRASAPSRWGEEDGSYTMYPEGYPDFPMAQLLDTAREQQRVTVSCLVSDLRFEWGLEPLRRRARHTHHRRRRDPRGGGRAPGDQREAIRTSLANLAELSAVDGRLTGR